VGEEAVAAWDAVVKQVPDEMDFVIRTYADAFPRGSQVFLCYGRMSNRSMLQRYGFCLPYNKYNFVFIKLRVEADDPDFQEKRHIVRKFFSVDAGLEGASDVSSKHFKLHFQRLNTKILKFVKILNFDPAADDLACVLESRSLSLEYLSFQRLLLVYEGFLRFPTNLGEDARLMREGGLSTRQHFALVYRVEVKRIVANQINLVKLVLHILERLMKGMTLEFAVTRVFELESKKEVLVNRVMINNYLTSLKKGLEKNQSEYLEMQQRLTQSEDPKKYLLENQRRLRLAYPSQAYAQQR